MRTENVLYTLETDRHSYKLPSNATLIYKQDATEERARVTEAWVRRSSLQEQNVFTITSETASAFGFVRAPSTGGSAELRHSVYLDDPDELDQFVLQLQEPLFIDITGLTHRTWAPLLQALLRNRLPPTLLYVEPMEYSASEQPTNTEIFNLSEKFGEISPIPGFARAALATDNPAFVPMLGFEGSRLTRLLDQTDYDSNSVYPIIGSPGYRPEYLHYAFKGNRDALSEGFLHSKVHFAKANCPFDAFYAIEELDKAMGRPFLKIAPIGTKPHGVGAVLFAISRGPRVELIYDHPTRSRDRTAGSSRLCVFDIPSFVTTAIFDQFGFFEDLDDESY